MDRNCGVYCIINQVNQKMYIGSSKNLKDRKKRHFYHLNSNKHYNEYLQKSFNKHGKENFKWEVLKYCKEDQLLKWEQHYINKYNVTNKRCGYNMMIRADRTVISDEIREKYRQKATGRKHTEETKKKLSIIHTGKKFSEETREKLRIARQGRKPSLGHKLTEEHKKKLKPFKKGHIPWIKGKKHSEETRKKMSEGKKETLYI